MSILNTAAIGKLKKQLKNLKTSDLAWDGFSNTGPDPLTFNSASSVIFNVQDDLTVNGTINNVPLTSLGNGSDFLANDGQYKTLASTDISDFTSAVNALQVAEVNDLSSVVTWANVPDANITQSSVTQHQAAISITESQISDFGTYLTAEVNDLSASVTWVNVPDANITESSVTQHQTALTITESQISDLGTYIPISQKAANNGVATLDSNGLIPSNQLPATAVSTTYTAASEVEQLALTVTSGDICVRTDENKTYIALNSDNVDMGDWQELLTSAVASVDGRTGTVTLDDLYSATGHSHTLDSLSNVTIVGNLDGEILRWNGTAWVNNTLSEAGIEPADGTILKDADIGVNVQAYNAALTGTTGTFLTADKTKLDYITVTGAINLDNVLTSVVAGDINAEASSDGHVLTSDGAGNVAWEAIPGAPSNLPDLNDVNITSVTSGEVLRYVGSEWINQTFAEAGIQPAGSYLTAEVNDLSSNVIWANVPDANITETSVTQHQAALSITESQISDFGTYIPASEKGALSGVASLGADGKVPSAQLPAIAITDTYSAVDETAQLALTVQKGDVCVRTDQNKSYIALNDTNLAMTDWQELLTPTDSVLSVDGNTGAVDLSGTYEPKDVTILKDADIGVNVQAYNAALTGTTATFLTADKTKVDYLTVTGSVDLDQINTDVTANNAKVTNATHTGDVTGDGALTIDKTALTGKTLVSATVDDIVLISDNSDTDNLKKVTIQTIVDLAGGGSSTFAGLTDTDLTGVASDEILTWNGTHWINETLAEAGIASTSHTHGINNLTDVDTATVAPTEGQVLKWNNTDGEWQPGNESGGGGANSSFVVATEVAQLALTVIEGDICVRTDETKSYVARNADNNDMGDWQEILSDAGDVISVDGKQGIVDLSGDYAAFGHNHDAQYEPLNNNLVDGPSSVDYDGQLALFDGTTGKLLKGDNRVKVQPDGRLHCELLSINTTDETAAFNIQASPTQPNTMILRGHSAYTGEVFAQFQHGNNTDAGANARWVVSTGGENGGDPYVNFIVSGITQYSMGIDNSEADEFVICTGNVIDVAQRKFTLAKTGEITTASTINGRDMSADGTKIDYLTVTGNVDLDQINTDVTANNAKVSNATHTGDVTGDTALTIDKTAITGKTEVVATASDYLLIADFSDSNNIKKTPIQDILNIAASGAGLTYTASDTAPGTPNWGDEWYNLDNGRLYKWTKDSNTTSFWLDVSAIGGGGSVTLKESDVIVISNASTTEYNFDYTVGFIQVFMNRYKLRKSEFTATNGTSIDILVDLEVGDELEFVTVEG